MGSVMTCGIIPEGEEWGSGGYDFVEAFYDAKEFFRRNPADSLAEALNGKGSNLGDFHPGPLRKTAAQQLHC